MTPFLVQLLGMGAVVIVLMLQIETNHRINTVEQEVVQLKGDLRKLACVPMAYLLSNRPTPKIHSYSKDLTICKEAK